MFVINIASVALKAISVTGTNFSSVFIDMLNDVGDSVGLGLLLLGLAYEKKRSNVLYPYGRRRALYVLGLISISIFSGLIFAVALAKTISLLQESVQPVVVKHSLYAFSAAFSLNVLGLIVAYSEVKSGNGDPATMSGLLDSLSDVVGSVLALSSIALTSVFLDVVGSFIISLVILVSAVTVGYRYFQVLIGRAPPKSVLKRVLERVLELSDVKDVNVFNATMITENDYMLVLEVEVDKDKDVEDLEKLSQIIEEEVKKTDPRFKHVIVEFVAERKEPKTYKKILSEIEGSE